MFERLVLGTAQLGMSYGIANKSGQPDQGEADSIVATALVSGINLFDTAQDYGNSEHVLGNALLASGNVKSCKIISKTSPQLPSQSLEDVKAGVQQSRQSLNVLALHCLMLHREEHLSLLDGKFGGLCEDLLQHGQIGSLGVSVYTQEAAIAALRHPLVSAIQLPASFLDRRFARAGVFDLAKKNEKKNLYTECVASGVAIFDKKKHPRTIQWIGSLSC